MVYELIFCASEGKIADQNGAFKIISFLVKGVFRFGHHSDWFISDGGLVKFWLSWACSLSRSEQNICGFVIFLEFRVLRLALFEPHSLNYTKILEFISHFFSTGGHRDVANKACP